MNVEDFETLPETNHFDQIVQEVPIVLVRDKLEWDDWDQIEGEITVEIILGYFAQITLWQFGALDTIISYEFDTYVQNETRLYGIHISIGVVEVILLSIVLINYQLLSESRHSQIKVR